MEEKEQYKSLINEVIAKQAIILGPDIAILKAKKVSGLKVTDEGKVLELKGNPTEVLQKLVDEYVELSGQIIKTALSSVFTKYPELKKSNHHL